MRAPESTSDTGAPTASRLTTATPSPLARSFFKAPPAPQFHNPVHAVVVSNDDLVYVADRTNNRFQVFRLDGTFVKEVFIARNTLQAEGTVHHFALSPDKAQQFLYVVDGSNKAVRILNRQTLEIVGERRRARRTQRARVLPHSQRRRRLEGEPVPRRGQQRTALLPVRVQRHGIGRKPIAGTVRSAR